MTFQMRVSEKLVSKLLHETEPGRAVCELSGFWSPRATRSLPRLGLSNTEYEVELCLIYHGEVFNGGHFQYFSNRGTAYCDDTMAALIVVGLPEYSSLLAEACKNLPAGVEYMEPHQQDDRMQGQWENADQVFREFEFNHSAAPRVDEKLLHHLQNNAHDFLIAERGLKSCPETGADR